MKAIKDFKNIAFAGLILSVNLSPAAPSTNQPYYHHSGRIVEETLKRFAAIGDRWNVGQTNLPLFSVHFFGPWDVVADTSVTREGHFSSGSFSEMGAKRSRYGQLDSTNLAKLHTMIDTLPTSPSNPIPVRRRLLVSGTRSNSWYSFMYDRADVPIEVERICDLVEGIIPWMPPSTSNSTHIAQVISGSGVLDILAVASSAPLAAGIGQDGLTIWSLEAWDTKFVPPTNYSCHVWFPAVIAPDGRMIVMGDWHKVIAYDLPSMKPRWVRTDPIRDRDRMWLWASSAVDHDQSLAVALADRMERWSLATGESLSVLGTDSVPYQNLMRASRDGSVLAADLGGGRIKIWTSPWTNSPEELVEHQWTKLMEISPDGRYLVLRSHGQMGARLVICDLQIGTRQEMPFRGCYNRIAYSAAWSPNGKYLAVGKTGQWPCVYDTTTWKPILLWRVPDDRQYWSGGPTVHLAWSRDGELLAACGDGFLRGLKLPLPETEPDRNFPVDR